MLHFITRLVRRVKLEEQSDRCLSAAIVHNQYYRPTDSEAVYNF